MQQIQPYSYSSAIKKYIYICRKYRYIQYRYNRYLLSSSGGHDTWYTYISESGFKSTLNPLESTGFKSALCNALNENTWKFKFKILCFAKRLKQQENHFSFSAWTKGIHFFHTLMWINANNSFPDYRKTLWHSCTHSTTSAVICACAAVHSSGECGRSGGHHVWTGSRRHGRLPLCDRDPLPTALRSLPCQCHTRSCHR